MDKSPADRPRRYWIFQARPDEFPLADLLERGRVDQWRLLRFVDRVGYGDVVYLWQAAREEAILGWGLVEGDSYADPSDPRHYRVPVRYQNRLREPLTRTVLRNDARLQHLSILRSPQGANFTVTIEQAVILNQMIRSPDSEPPPDPAPFIPWEILLDGDLSPTTRRIVEGASEWIRGRGGSVPALGTALLLHAFVAAGVDPQRTFLDTARWLAQRAPGLDSLRDKYLADPLGDPELAGAPDGAGPLATLDAALVLAAATRIAVTTTRRPRVSQRHLLGALLEAVPLARNLAARVQLEQAGTGVGTLRREFREYLRQYHSKDLLGEWEKVLIPAGEGVSLLTGYSSDLPEGEDKLDIAPEVDALASLVASKVITPPLSIGLFGDWGSGKSFFMNKMIDRVAWICQNLAPGSNPHFCRNIIQIRLNAWHYSEANIWASLVTHIFDNLRLTVEGEDNKDTERAVEKRRELILAELGELEKLREQAQRELEDAERELDRARSARAAADGEASRREQELEAASARDVLDGLRLTPDIEKLYAGAQKTLGLSEVAKDAREVYAVVQQVHTIGGQAQALWLSIVNSEDWRRRLLWLGGVLAAFVVLALLVNAPWFDTANETWEAIKVFVAGVVGLAGVGAGWLRTHLGSARQAMDLLRQADQAFAQQKEDERHRIRETLDARKLAYEEQLKKVDQARREVEEANQVVAEKEVELRDLEPDRLFARFIQERALSEDYRKELGILSLVRKDFERLAEFLSREHSGEEAKYLAVDRIILYVDDLDRCPVDTVVKVLQAVHLLLGLSLFVVVVAVDERWIRRALVQRYGDLLEDRRPHLLGSEEQVGSKAATSEDYLEKIFQVPFWIKPMGDEGARDLVRDLLKEDLESAIVSVDDEPDVEKTKDQRTDTQGRVITPTEELPSVVPVDVDMEARVVYDPTWILEPQRLILNKEELRVIETLAPILGRSPRAVKRFVNVYRILRAGLHRDELSSFLGGDRKTPSYPAVLLLLAILNGSPSLATELFKGLVQATSKDTLKRFVNTLEKDSSRTGTSEWQRFFGILTPFVQEWGGSLTVGDFQEWAPRVARYSFRMEMVKETK